MMLEILSSQVAVRSLLPRSLSENWLTKLYNVLNLPLLCQGDPIGVWKEGFLWVYYSVSIYISKLRGNIFLGVRASWRGILCCMCQPMNLLGFQVTNQSGLVPTPTCSFSCPRDCCWQASTPTELSGLERTRCWLYYLILDIRGYICVSGVITHSGLYSS